MKVLITGGKGYIARNLVPLFEAGGYEVLAPARTELDLLNKNFLTEYLQKNQPSVIIHAASRGGQKLGKDTWEDTYVQNITMFENLCLCQDASISKIIILGSGAEFDRRYPIQNKSEDDVRYCWPTDPYGLSKNIITRRTVDEFFNTYVLRLFGCFHFDEDPTRFIKSGILNLKRGLPVTVHQNREMDFFYLDDIFTVMDYIINARYVPTRNINLVYDDKMTLLDIASLIHKHVGKFEPVIKLIENGRGDAYSGSSEVLHYLPIKLLGLEEGIRRTVNKLT